MMPNRSHPPRRHTLQRLSAGLLAAALLPHARAQSTAAGAVPFVAAEVRRVDAGAAKLTLKHEAMPHLDMPAMTMVFQVKDPALLQGLENGMKVKVAVEKQGSAYVVTGLQRTD